jgi:IS605 OrfB family transposase
VVAENSKECYASGLANLAGALGNWKASRDGSRNGPKMRFPVFKVRRAGPDRRDGRQPSARWRKTQTQISRAHARAANLRQDGLHKLTTWLAARYGTIVVEDLNVAGMLKNRRLARRISDAGFGTLRRQLCYKIPWHGGRLVTAGRFYPRRRRRVLGAGR